MVIGGKTYCDECKGRIHAQKFVEIKPHKSEKLYHYHVGVEKHCWERVDAEIFIPKKEVVFQSAVPAIPSQKEVILAQHWSKESTSLGIDEMID